MKILKVDKSDYTIIQYKVEYEFNGETWIASFDDYDWYLSEKEIIDQITNYESSKVHLYRKQ